jgi:hypothetical protein
MQSWLLHFRTGHRALRRHKPARAISEFEQALRECPIEKGESIARTMYLLGVALSRLGYRESALKTWIAGTKLRKRGKCGRMSRRFSNEYGMLRQPTGELDDWNAFFSIQYARYIRIKPMKRIVSPVERDMIHDLIFQYWKAIRSGYDLHTLSPIEKLRLFRSTEIIFPLTLMHENQTNRRPPIPVRFGTKARVHPDGPCICGSGRPYLRCCGRVQSAEEIENGLI